MISLLKIRLSRSVVPCSVWLLACHAAACHAAAWAATAKKPQPDSRFLQAALMRTVGANSVSAVVLRWEDGTIAARVGKDASSTPGSAIKPLLLASALQHDTVTRSTSVYCRRSLRVGTVRLPCTHPADVTTFIAQSALAASCNTYFAAVADRMHGAELEAALRATQLPHADATNDTQEQKEFTVLGLRGVSASPLQLARAYRTLMRSEAQDSPVLLGLADSVNFGMANGARVHGVKILGKTGTATAQTGGATHGWFAGGVPGSVVLVVYVPQGNGGDAAILAGAFFHELSSRQMR